MSYNPTNPNGQATSANSSPVVIASDQSAVAVSVSGVATSANQTNGTQQSKITDGTNVANVVAGDTGYNGQAVTSGTKTISFTTSTTGAQTLLANTNVEGYSYVTIILTSVGAGLAWTAPFSPNTGGTYFATSAWQTPNSAVGALGIVVSTPYRSPTYGNFMQLAITAMTGGTTSGYVILSGQPINPNYLTASVINTVTTTGTMTPLSGTNNGTITTSASTVTSTSISGVGGFAQVSVYGVYSGVSFSILVSNNGGTTYFNVPVYDTNAALWRAAGATITPAGSSNSMYWVPIPSNAALIKVQASAWTSGTATVYITSGNGGTPGSIISQGLSTGTTAATVPTNASLIGGQARTSDISAVTNGYLTGLVADQKGSLITTPYAISANYYSGTSSTSGASSTVLIAGVASNYLYITSYHVSNTSATPVTVALQNGSGGTTIDTIIVPAGGGAVVTLPTPIKVGTTGNGLYYQVSASVSTVYITATAYAQAY